jgi:hypothetical protein
MVLYSRALFGSEIVVVDVVAFDGHFSSPVCLSHDRRCGGAVAVLFGVSVRGVQ